MRTSILLGAMWLVFLNGPEPAKPAQTGSDRSVARALDDLRSGRVFEAVEGLTEIVQNDPFSSAAYFYLSVIHTDTGQLERAGELVARALDIDPGEGKFHYQRGLILMRGGDRVEARSALRRALELGMAGEEATAWRNLGDVEVLLLGTEAALEAYQQAVSLAPDDARNRLALGHFYLDFDQSEAALTQLLRAVALDPTLDGVYASLGLALRRQGRTDAAIDALRRGVELNPADQTARYALAQSLMASGRTEEARVEIEAYQALDARIARANAAIDGGTERFESGDLAQARSLLEEAVALAPNYSAAYQRLGEVLLAGGEPDLALDPLERSVRLNPLSAGAYFSLGAALKRSGRFEDALEATRKAIVLDSGVARYQRQFGELLGELGRSDEARRAFESAARLERD